MKPRKKTKLCLQCNGVNPISASHCAYCGALLGAEEVEKTSEAAFHAGSTPAQDLFAAGAPYTQSPVKTPAPYQSSLTSHGFVQDRQPAISDEGVEKPLYSVFDQPQDDQMGGLQDELTRSPKITSNLQKQQATPIPGLLAKISAFFSKSPAIQEAADVQGKASSDLTDTLAAGALATGTTLVFLSLVTFIFSHDGKVVVSWSEQTAAWLMLISIAMIVFGWKMTSSRQSR
jgi:hypothetical protein